MRLKSSVKAIGMSTELLLGLCVADGVYDELGYDCIITSINDSKHGLTSLHNSGNAADLRTKHITEEHMKHWVRSEIEKRLTVDYDVLLEDVGGENEHIHIEYQPRTR